MALTLQSWPGSTGFSSIAYFSNFIEQMQRGMPAGNGVLPYRSDDVIGSYSSEFLVVGDSTGMQVKVNQGCCHCKGIFAKIADADAVAGKYTLPITAAHATLYRVDAVVIEFNLSAGGATLKTVDGTPAASGSQVPAALTQNATTWQVLLAYVNVNPAVATIAVADVIDSRQFVPPTAELLKIMRDDNPIANGQLDIWQRGVTFTGIANAAYGPDRFVYTKVGTVVHDLLRSTDVPAIADPNAPHANYSLHLDVTTADAAIAAADACIIGQKIEGYFFHRFAGRAFSISFWVKGSKTGVHCLAVQNSNGDRSCVMEYLINAADTWEFKTVHFPASPSAGTWDYGTGIGLYVMWILSAGSNFQTATPGQWVSANVLATARQVNETDNAANNFRLALIGPLVAGNQSVPFQGRPYNQELDFCQRYFQKTFPINTAPATAAGREGVWAFSIGAGFVAGGYWGFATRMRAAPTGTGYNPISANANWRNISANTDGGGLFFVATEVGAGIILVGAAGDGAGSQMEIHVTASAEL